MTTGARAARAVFVVLFFAACAPGLLAEGEEVLNFRRLGNCDTPDRFYAEAAQTIPDSADVLFFNPQRGVGELRYLYFLEYALYPRRIRSIPAGTSVSPDEVRRYDFILWHRDFMPSNIGDAAAIEAYRAAASVHGAEVRAWRDRSWGAMLWKVGKDRSDGG